MRKQKTFPFWFFFFILLFISSCRKSDSEIPETETKPNSTERFFNLSASADPRLKSIAQSIMAQEKEHPFLNDFTKRAGWPVWDKAKIIDKSNRSSGRGSNTDSSALVYIPFVQDTTIVVNAILAVRMNTTDTAWRMLYASNYAAFGFDNTTDTTWNARNVFQFFALFQYDIFGHTRFLIKDERLFNTTSDSFLITLKERNGVTINNRTSRTTEWHELVQCGIWQICGTPPAQPRINSLIGDCWAISICNTYYWDDGLYGGGGTGWTGSSWSSGEGGGGSGVWANDDPCSAQSTCTAAWTPVTSYTTIDGITYTTEYYPGNNEGLPWLWWEDPNYDFIVPANGPNLDLTDYLKCFTNDPSCTYKITIAVDQPVSGTRTTYTTGNNGSSGSSSNNNINIDAGHTFFILEQTYPNGISIVRNIGFYPTNHVNPLFPNSDGILKNNQSTHFDVSLTTTVSSFIFFSLLDLIKANPNEHYNLNSSNCTSYCTNKLNQIGINIPETIGSWLGGGSGINPGDLGEDIRNMQLQSNQTRNTVGGSSPNNNITC